MPLYQLDLNLFATVQVEAASAEEAEHLALDWSQDQVLKEASKYHLAWTVVPLSTLPLHPKYRIP